MGVPVVALYGNTSEGRASAGILTGAGLKQFIARDKQEYKDIAFRTASDLIKLESLRSGLRDQLAATPVGDPQQYVGLVEKSYCDMWRRWCEQQSNESLAPIH